MSFFFKRSKKKPEVGTILLAADDFDKDFVTILHLVLEFLMSQEI